MKILPVEVKSGTSGKMKSLRMFIERKGLAERVCTSLENFGKISFTSENDTTILISIIPIYAIGRLSARSRT